MNDTGAIIMRTSVHLASLSALCALGHAMQSPPQSPSIQPLAASTVPMIDLGVATGTNSGMVPSSSTGIAPASSGGSAYSYCQATSNSSGTIAFVGYAGSLDLQQGSFTLFCTGAAIHPTSFGMFVYGTNQTSLPFGNGFLCVSPFSRMPATPLISETVFLDLASRPLEFELFLPGSSWNFQFLYRDGSGGGAGFNSSKGLHVEFAP
jgi:hypothetical protein